MTQVPRSASVVFPAPIESADARSVPRADPEADDLLWVANDAGFTRGVSGDCCRIGTCTWSPCSVLIGNIPPSVTLAELQDLLNSQGELMEFFYSYLGASLLAGLSRSGSRPSVSMMSFSCKRQWKIAYATYRSSDSAELAVRCFNGKRLFPHHEYQKVVVCFAQPAPTSLSAIPFNPDHELDEPHVQNFVRCLEHRLDFEPKYCHVTASGMSEPQLLPIDVVAKLPECPGSSLLRDGPPGANLFLYGVPSDWNENPLLEICQEFGHVVGIRVPSSATDGPRLNRGFGFVSYDRTDCAHQALAVLPAISFLGKSFKVQLKRGEEHLCPPELVHLVQPSSARRSGRKYHDSYENPWSEPIMRELPPNFQLSATIPPVVSTRRTPDFDVPPPAAPVSGFEFDKEYDSLGFLRL
ncbi:MAG: hypothetical protein KVP17_003572, partial [Porospora cf. gigantea B]|uniref:uncharacterized protein n=1 Tax=Porospora cf. gigantea B TaxID=2853592 RepID=UPI003571FA0B